jgi:hypothetical protein
MCRRTMQAVFADLGEIGKLRVFDELNDVRDMAEIDAQCVHADQARAVRDRRRFRPESAADR